MEGESQTSLPNFTPGQHSSKVASIVKQGNEHQQDSVSIDLSNQKLGIGHAALEGFGDRDQQQLFSKTATNEFLAVSTQMENIHPGDQLMSQMLDSQTSSPTLKSDLALRTTAQFTHIQMPPGVTLAQPMTGN